MAYNLIITDRADELIDERVSYLIIKFKNPQAAAHLLGEISGIYDRMVDNPYQIPRIHVFYGADIRKHIFRI